MKRIVLSAGLSAAAFAALAAPSLEDVSFVQAADGEVTISYTLSDEEAIVTFDVLSGGASLGGAALRDVTSASDCWKVVQPGARTIRWRPHGTLDGAEASVEVSAWSVGNPPPVMAVDLLPGTAAADRVRYYPTLDHLPGGLLENAAYRTSKVVFRKVMGAGVGWKMGAPSSMPQLPEGERFHDAVLSRNYYLGVFEFTQGQYLAVAADCPSHYAVNRAMRPLERVCFNELRCNALGQTAYAGSGAFADAPYAGSLLDLVRQRTGVAVDLPTEAEWEFACKAGGDGSHWDNGANITAANDADENMNGRHRYNGGYVNGQTEPVSSADVDLATAVVGSYAPNAWGFFDMHGNVFEYCLDWYEADVSTRDGAVNINPADPAKTLSGATGSGRVRRGGSWHVGTWSSRTTIRLECSPTGRAPQWGFRPLVPAGTSPSEGPAARASSAVATLSAVGSRAESSAGPLDARILTCLASEAVGIKAVPPRGLAIVVR